MKRETPCYVYRLYDRFGMLLYVGMTHKPRQRRSDHRRTKEWWPEVASWRLTLYPDARTAHNAEAVAIWTETPFYNINGVRRQPPSVKTNSAVVQALSAFDAEYAAENDGTQPSQVLRRRVALRVIRSAAA